ncbi:MAG: HEAT repeat domain-containing protein [Elusimicrobia bacterium]|nr:HEAT repeat domain-containing protein [Elusimicrobiota bacterium]
MSKSALILAAALFCACGEITVKETSGPVVPGGPVKTDAAINNALVDLLQNKDHEKVDMIAISGTPAADILALGSPIGFTLRNRYLSIGVPLAEALSRNDDPDFRKKLIELARWERDGETRASALIALARAHDLADFDVFREALINLDPAVRFGALEALTVWGHPDKSLQWFAMGQDSRNEPEPILRVFAARALAGAGDARGLPALRGYLDNASWLVRAMAARYLGDYGSAADYDELVSRLGREQQNDFTLAEDCIAALKLFPQKAAAVRAANKAARAPVKEEPAPASKSAIPDSEPVFQLEALVISAPRVKLAADAILDPSIGSTLLRLLRDRQDARPDPQAQLDASVGNLNKISTLDGYNLKTRYTQLGFLLTDGLAGSKDYGIDQALEDAARLGSNVQIQAAAMVALAYTKELRYTPLFQGMLNNANITVRFGALESLLVQGETGNQFIVDGAARADSSLAMQVYAAAGLWRMGNIFGREILLRLYQHKDWFVRAMASHYLGELGGPSDAGDLYRKLMIELQNEANPSVKAELVSSLLRLQKFKED